MRAYGRLNASRQTNKKTATSTCFFVSTKVLPSGLLKNGCMPELREHLACTANYLRPWLVLIYCKDFPVE
jgi:hypothetical protein